jgi:chromosome segregation ATPase
MVTTKVKVLVVLAAIAAFGCSKHDTDSFVAQSQSAVKGVSSSVGKAWTSLNDQARNLDPSSSTQDLEKMKAQMADMEQKAAKTSKEQADAAKAQWDRLDLAEKVQNLQKDSEAKLKELDDDRKTASKNLEETNKEYEEAQAKLKDAQNAYDEATKRAEGAWKSISGQ